MAPAGPVRRTSAAGIDALERARRLGHRAETILGRSPRPAPRRGPERSTGRGGQVPAATVQRRPWLENADQGIYRDEDFPDVDLTFVRTSGGKNTGTFMEWSNLAGLQHWVRSKIEPMMGVVHIDQLIKNLVEGVMTEEDTSSEFRETVGQLYVEKGLNLKKAGGEIPRGIVLDLVRLGLLVGPRIRREGGGSRLPTAVGKLFYDQARYKDRDAVLAGLGVEEEKLASYKKVQGVAVEAKDFKELAEQAVSSGQPTFGGDGYLYVSAVRKRLSPNRQVLAAGKLYSEDFREVTTEEEALLLDKSYEALGTPDDSGWVDKLSGGRDGDQVTAMDKWNALGAAAFHNAFRADQGGPVTLDQNFEWLHVRGAQVGGGTGKGNLLSGTFSTNSEMIPLESQLNKWFKGKKGGKVEARFSAVPRDRVLGERIRIRVAAENHPVLGTIPRTGELYQDFYPLKGRVVDKLFGQIQRRGFQLRSALALAEGRAEQAWERKRKLERKALPLRMQLMKRRRKLIQKEAPPEAILQVKLQEKKLRRITHGAFQKWFKLAKVEKQKRMAVETFGKPLE